MFPPSLGILIYLGVKKLVFPDEIGNALHFLIAAIIIGYICYDSTHYFLHHSDAKNSVLRRLKIGHNTHHYKENTANFGITNILWDLIANTAYSRGISKQKRRNIRVQ